MNVTELLIVDCHLPCGDLLIAFQIANTGRRMVAKASRRCGWYNSLAKKVHLKGPGDLDSLPARAIRKWAGPDASPALIVRPSAWANPFRPEHHMEHTTGSSNSLWLTLAFTGSNHQDGCAFYVAVALSPSRPARHHADCSGALMRTAQERSSQSL